MPSFAKSVLAILIAILGIVSVWRVIQYFSPAYIHQKDFIQEYLLAKAVLTHTDPYAPIPDLAARFLGSLDDPVFVHPTPHPPVVGLLFSPLGLLSYQHAAQTWFVVQLALLAVSVRVVLSCVCARVQPFSVLVCSSLAVALSPFFQDLVLGQLMILKLSLLVGAWSLLRSGREAGGGLFLGAAVAVKFIAWPLVLLLTIQRRWKAVVAACTAIFAANGLAALVIGANTVAAYYTKVGPLVSALYRGHASNFSVWSLASRVFAGTDSPVLCGIKAAPAWSAPELAGALAPVAPVALLGLGVLACVRLGRTSFDAAFAMMTCVSVLISPVTWCCYLVLAAIPVALIVKRLLELQFPATETNVAVLTAVLLILSPNQLNEIMISIGNPAMALACRPVVPFPLTAISLVPLVGVLGLMWLVWTLEGFPVRRGSDDIRGAKGMPG